MRGRLLRLFQDPSPGISIHIRYHRIFLTRVTFWVAWAALCLLTAAHFLGWLPSRNSSLEIALAAAGQVGALLCAFFGLRGQWGPAGHYNIVFLLLLGAYGAFAQGPDTLTVAAFYLAIFIAGVVNGMRPGIWAYVASLGLLLTAGLSHPDFTWAQRLGGSFAGAVLLTAFTLLLRFAQYQVERTVTALHNRGERLMAEVSERKRIEEELKRLSTHDSLTGLFNRAFFQAESDRMQNGRFYPISIIMMDVDKLKKVNDTYGHHAGDELLRRVANLLRDTFRVEDVVARLGGDEFAVLLPSTDPAAAADAVQRVKAAIRRELLAQPQLPIIQLSIGASTAFECCVMSEVMKEADDRMYIDKGRRKTQPRRQPSATA